MSLNIENLRVSLQKKKILHGIDLEIQEGEFVSLLGKSGCGKTTLLKCIAGLLEQESGDIRIQGASVVDQQPKERGTVIVFQDLRLFPHMTAEKNIAFPMELRKVPKKEQKERVEALLRAVQLPGFEKRRMKEMSGGQMQRVALARAIVIHPQVLLMDEPLSNLDAKLRIEMRSAIRDVQKQVGITTVYVTHDQEECFAISDKVAIMNHGVIEQMDTPSAIYNHPKTEFIARFVGFENFLNLKKDGENYLAEDGSRIQVTEKKDGEQFKACIRPEDIQIVPEGENAVNPLSGEIVVSTFLGKRHQYNVRTAIGELEVSTDQECVYGVGDQVTLSLTPNKIILL